MRTAILILLALCITAVPVFADSTTKADYSVPRNQGFEDFLNNQDYITHTHDLDKVARFQKTIGLDLITYQSDLIKITSESRYNFESNITTSGAVIELNVFKFFQK